MAFFLMRLKPLLGLLALAGLLTVGAVSFGGSAQAQTPTIGPSGQPIPRFVSLKSDRVNVRKGPSREHDVVWTYVHAGLPVEVVQEYENWRRIRDWQGEMGWVFHSLLSSRRTALVTPWDESLTTPLRARPESGAPIVAELKANVLATVTECGSGWCRLHGTNYDGWIDQKRLFGIYEEESFD